jgi:hypothetical protein
VSFSTERKIARNFLGGKLKIGFAEFFFGENGTSRNRIPTKTHVSFCLHENGLNMARKGHDYGLSMA